MSMYNKQLYKELRVGFCKGKRSTNTLPNTWKTVFL